MSGTKNKTILKKMIVKKFRNMDNIEIDFGKRITIISGKNGTAKSTILGLVAQIFSFDKNYVTGSDIEFETLNGKAFKSDFKDHFRFSENFDLPGEMDVQYEIYDAYINKDIDSLKLELTAVKDRTHRTVVRNNIPTEYTKNTSRNVTHPVIYLSLKRLYPIAERRQEATTSIQYLTDHASEFIYECNNIIGKRSGNSITSTKGTIISSSVVHGENYDNQSVSSGEDNVGQIVQALFSFKKLSEEYTDYKGGILIIDELDAGLFPYAQDRIIKALQTYARKYNIQIIASTHSPIIIENIYQKSINNQSKDFKSIFLSQSHGNLQVKSNYGWEDIYADLFITTKKLLKDFDLPRINIYCEDSEAFSFLERLLNNGKLKKAINPIYEVTIGCTCFKKLMKQKIPEFTHKSIIVLDGDQSEIMGDSIIEKNVIFLPTIQPPDRLIFKFLFSLPPNDDFWSNSAGFTKEVFENIPQYSLIAERLDLNQNNIDDFDDLVQQELDDKSSTGLRNLFKDFYNNIEFQATLNSVKTNPFEEYLKRHPEQRSSFKTEFLETLKYVWKHGHGISSLRIQKHFP